MDTSKAVVERRDEIPRDILEHNLKILQEELIKQAQSSTPVGEWILRFAHTIKYNLIFGAALGGYASAGVAHWLAKTYFNCDNDYYEIYNATLTNLTANPFANTIDATGESKSDKISKWANEFLDRCKSTSLLKPSFKYRMPGDALGSGPDYGKFAQHTPTLTPEMAARIVMWPMYTLAISILVKFTAKKLYLKPKPPVIMRESIRKLNVFLDTQTNQAVRKFCNTFELHLTGLTAQQMFIKMLGFVFALTMIDRYVVNDPIRSVLAWLSQYYPGESGSVGSQSKIPLIARIFHFVFTWNSAIKAWHSRDNGTLAFALFTVTLAVIVTFLMKPPSKKTRKGSDVVQATDRDVAVLVQDSNQANYQSWMRKLAYVPTMGALFSQVNQQAEHQLLNVVLDIVRIIVPQKYLAILNVYASVKTAEHEMIMYVLKVLSHFIPVMFYFINNWLEKVREEVADVEGNPQTLIGAYAIKHGKTPTFLMCAFLSTFAYAFGTQNTWMHEVFIYNMQISTMLMLVTVTHVASITGLLESIQAEDYKGKVTQRLTEAVKTIKPNFTVHDFFTHMLPQSNTLSGLASAHAKHMYKGVAMV